ncbi:MAG TPA: hypothetical protein VFB77_16290 [Acidimicrobiales bacterium]|nr:hypothetical protein [Acidimicrobiales bacterium]
MHFVLYLMAAVDTLRSRLADAVTDDRGEINSNVAWAGLMLVVAVAVGAIVMTQATGAAERFDFGF